MTTTGTTGVPPTGRTPGPTRGGKTRKRPSTTGAAAKNEGQEIAQDLVATHEEQTTPRAAAAVIGGFAAELTEAGNEEIRDQLLGLLGGGAIHHPAPATTPTGAEPVVRGRFQLPDGSFASVEDGVNGLRLYGGLVEVLARKGYELPSVAAARFAAGVPARDFRGVLELVESHLPRATAAGGTPATPAVANTDPTHHGQGDKVRKWAMKAGIPAIITLFGLFLLGMLLSSSIPSIGGLMTGLAPVAALIVFTINALDHPWKGDDHD